MPRIVDHAQRRQEIVAAVWQLIATHGFEGVTLRAVAAEAGISVGRVQHYYGSRAELVRDGCVLMLEQARAQFFARIEPLPPLERLRTLLRRAVPTTTGWTYGTLVWNAYQAKSVDDPEIAVLVRQAHTAAVGYATQYLEDARRDGVLADDVLGDDSAADLGLRLLATSEGYATRVIVGSLASEDALRALDRELDALRA